MDEDLVYFVQAENGQVKIGTTTNFGKRLADLQQDAGSLTVLKIVKGGRGLERHIHDHFRDYRLKGEWFSADPDFLTSVFKEDWGPRQEDEPQTTLLAKVEQESKFCGIPSEPKGVLVRIDVQDWMAMRVIAAELTSKSGQRHTLQSLIWGLIKLLRKENEVSEVAQ